MARRDPASDAPSSRATRQSARLNSQPPSSVPVTPPKSDGGRARGRPRKDAASKEELQLVEEEPATEADLVNEEVFRDATDALAQLRTPGNRSNLSGATAVSTSHSAIGSQDMARSTSALLARLPDLNDDSARILRQLAPLVVTLDNVSDTAKQLQSKNSLASKQSNVFESTFVEWFESFTGDSDEDGYLDPDLILQTVFNKPHDNTSVEWRPDDILYKANLAKMILRIMRLQREDSTTVATLKSLNDSFSSIFFSSISPNEELPGSSYLVGEAFNAALALRTQLALVSCQQDDDFDNVLRDLFLNSNRMVVPNAEPQMKGWGVKAFQINNTTHLRQPFQAKALETYQSLHKALSSGSSSGPNHVFSWPNFQFQIASWAAFRTTELNARIAKMGGAERISSLLQQEIQKASIPTKTQKKQATSDPLISRIDKQGQDLAKRAKKLSGNSRLIRAPIHQAPASDPIPAMRNNALQNENADNSFSKRGRSLIDRQPTAQRLSFDDSQSSHSQSVIELGKPTRTRGSQIIDQDVIVTQDQGFRGSSGGQHANQGARKRQKTGPLKQVNRGAAMAQISQKRSRENDIDRPSKAKRVRRADEQSNNQPVNRTEDPRDLDFQPENEESENEPDEPAALNLKAPKPPRADWVPPASNLTAATLAARQYSYSRKQGIQKRNAWTALESSALLDYIARYGTSYAFIKLQDRNISTDQHGNPLLDADGELVIRGPNYLFRRDQVAIKDKARNMKVDYLKAGLELPPNLDKIPLKKADVDKLRSMGIDADG